MYLPLGYIRSPNFLYVFIPALSHPFCSSKYQKPVNVRRIIITAFPLNLLLRDELWKEKGEEVT